VLQVVSLLELDVEIEFEIEREQDWNTVLLPSN